MLLSGVLLIVGLALLIGGADLLVRGVSALAAALGVPALVVGMTVVAFGTSTPEIVINVMSAASGETSLAFGNVVGACAVNVGFVLALTAMIRPLTVEPSIIVREIPMMMLAATSMLVMAADVFLGGGADDVLDRTNGLMLLLLFCVFLYYTVMALRNRRAADAFVEEVQENVKRARPRLRWLDAALTLGGLVGVAVGGRMGVAGAVGIAEALGVPSVIIGLTIVSLGTTSPELATCIQAARRGHSDIALGNVVGSNIFNLLFIGGLVATIRPVPVPVGGLYDLLFVTVLCVITLPIALRGQMRVTRGEGAFLGILYAAYLAARLVL
jgi:cation:H+ antiporter